VTSYLRGEETWRPLRTSKWDSRWKWTRKLRWHYFI